MGNKLCCLVPCKDAYTGEFRGRRKHGRGVYRWANGDSYNGEWVNDARQGKGVQQWGSGAQYDGEWKNDRQHGYGVYKNSTTATTPSPSLSLSLASIDSIVSYSGQWASGVRSGSGLQLYSDGTVYNGEFSDDLPHGEGELVHKDGASYVGHFHSGRYHGHGTLTALNGDRKEGPFVRGKLQGPGKLTKYSGDEITGTFVDDVIRGDGTIVKADLTYTYTGAIVDDSVKHGLGVLALNDSGETLMCHWDRDRPLDSHGAVSDVIYGKYQYSCGDCYEGSLLVLSNDTHIHIYERHGEGELTYSDGAVYNGEFSHNLRCGSGKLTNTDGSFYDGDWLNDQRNGFGVSVSDNDNEPRYEGQWRDDQRHGRGKLFYPQIALTLTDTDAENDNDSEDGGDDEDVFVGEWVHDRLVNVTDNLRLAPFRLLNERLALLQQSLSDTTTDSDHRSDGDRSVDTLTQCWQCKSRRAQCLVLECAHVSLCDACAASKPTKCPRCHRAVGRLLPVIES